jgi:hypothetical protein
MKTKSAFNSGLTPGDMRKWQSDRGFSASEAASMIGVALSTYYQMIQDGSGYVIDLKTALACAAIASGVPPLKPVRKVEQVLK